MAKTTTNLETIDDQAERALQEAAAAQLRAQELKDRAERLAAEREETRGKNRRRYSQWLVDHFEEDRAAAAQAVMARLAEFERRVPECDFSDMGELVRLYQALREAVVREVECYLRAENANAFLGSTTWQGAQFPKPPTRNLGSFSECIDRALDRAEGRMVAELRDQGAREVQDSMDGKFPGGLA